MKDDMPELKPCPFCGSDDISIFEKVEDRKFKFIGCWNCGCRTQEEFTVSVITKAWNTREDDLKASDVIKVVEGFKISREFYYYDETHNQTIDDVIEAINNMR